MQIAVQTGGITGHFNFDLIKTLNTIKRCGFTAIDWNIPTGIDLRQIVEKDYSKNVFEKSIEEIKEHYLKIRDMVSVLGLDVAYRYLSQDDINLYHAYEQAKINKDYQRSDMIRSELIEKGIL